MIKIDKRSSFHAGLVFALKFCRLSLNSPEFNELQSDDPITAHFRDESFIVRNYNQVSIIIRNRLSQHRQALHIQVIGGFVQHNQLWRCLPDD